MGTVRPVSCTPVVYVSYSDQLHDDMRYKYVPIWRSTSKYQVQVRVFIYLDSNHQSRNLLYPKYTVEFSEICVSKPHHSQLARYISLQLSIGLLEIAFLRDTYEKEGISIQSMILL